MSILTIKTFIINIFKYILLFFKTWLIDVHNNIEPAIILIFGSIGATALLSEIPFHIILPIWIETTMITPILGILIIIILINVMKWRGVCEP